MGGFSQELPTVGPKSREQDTKKLGNYDPVEVWSYSRIVLHYARMHTSLLGGKGSRKNIISIKKNIFPRRSIKKIIRIKKDITRIPLARRWQHVEIPKGNCRKSKEMEKSSKEKYKKSR